MTNVTVIHSNRYRAMVADRDADGCTDLTVTGGADTRKDFAVNLLVRPFSNSVMHCAHRAARAHERGAFVVELRMSGQ